MIRTVCAAGLLFAAALCNPPSAHADVDACQYPMVGTAVKAFGALGGFCDGPSEINGSHWHCEAGGFSLGGGGSITGEGGGALNAVGLLGAGGASCTWRCPDNTLAPAPNPPGAWRDYLVPRVNACAEHMEPAGFWSEPVRADEGAP